MGWIAAQPALVFTVALGIAVDDTIHLMARYKESLRNGEGIAGAVETAVVRQAGG